MSPVRQTNPSAAGAVTIQGDRVVKIQEPSASRRERLRTQAGREVGLRTGLFVVPEILSFDDDKGEIVFQRLELTGFRDALSHSGRSMQLVSRAGQALAAIHRDLEVTGEPRPTDRSLVPLHGDFAVRNVFHLAPTDALAIIDWSNAWWMEFSAAVGPPEVDVAVFLMSLFHRRVFGPSPISRRYDVARCFLSSYSTTSPAGLNLEKLAQIVATMVPRFNQKTSRSKGRLRALGYRHNMPDLQLFLHRLSS